MAALSIKPDAVLARHSAVGEDEQVVTLTEREYEILTHVFRGKLRREVAEMMNLSKRIVDVDLAKVYRKLRVSNVVQAARRATRLGLIPYECLIAD